MLAASMNAPVAVMETAGEGGPWGMALLASYMVNGEGQSLGDFLAKKVFASSKVQSVTATQEDIDGFDNFFAAYTRGLAVEKAAILSVN